jgi:hypothetical protein
MLPWLGKLITEMLPFVGRVTVTLTEALIAGGALGGLIAIGRRIQDTFGTKDTDTPAPRAH